MVTVPISIGELFDKISILEIKSVNIKEENKLKNIKNELDMLQNIAKKLKENFLDDFHYKKLKKVNAYLWEIEEGKREHEKKKKFGGKFVYLARQVYIFNDERARIKNAINKKYKSGIVEEKSYKNYL